MRRDYHVWRSPALGRDMELLVFGDSGTPVLVFPTRMARFHEYEDGGCVAAVADKIGGGKLRLFCVDSLDRETLYDRERSPRDRILRHLSYERYILDEVVPFIRSVEPTPFLMIHGCSLGAYHAVNFAFRRPDLFNKVVAFSGRYDPTLAVEDFADLFDGHRDDDVYFNSPSQFVPNLTDEAILARLRAMEIILVIGDKDPFLDNNLAFSEALWAKGVWHARHVWPGRAHSFRHWRSMAKAFL